MTDTAKHTSGPWFMSRKHAIGPRSKADDQSNGMIVPVADVYGENQHQDALLIAASPDLLEALKPFAAVFEKDIGSAEADEELFQVNNQNRAPKLTVGDFRRAFQAVFEAEGQS